MTFKLLHHPVHQLKCALLTHGPYNTVFVYKNHLFHVPLVAFKYRFHNIQYSTFALMVCMYIYVCIRMYMYIYRVLLCGNTVTSSNHPVLLTVTPSAVSCTIYCPSVLSSWTSSKRRNAIKPSSSSGPLVCPLCPLKLWRNTVPC